MKLWTGFTCRSMKWEMFCHCFAVKGINVCFTKPIQRYCIITCAFFSLQLGLNSEAFRSIYPPWSNWCRDLVWEERRAWRDVKTQKGGKSITISKRKKNIIQKKEAYFKSLADERSSPNLARWRWGPADVGPLLQMVHASGGDAGVMLSWSFSSMAFISPSLFCLLCGKVLRC